MPLQLIYNQAQCDHPLGEHHCDECGSTELGGIRSVALIHENFNFLNPSDPAEWNAGILSGNIKIIPFTKGSFKPSSIKGAGYGDQKERFTGWKFELDFQDPDYALNCDFYNALAYSNKWRVAYRTDTMVHIGDKVATLEPMAEISDNIESDVTWKVKATWSSKKHPCPVPKPAGIFKCFDIQNTSINCSQFTAVFGQNSYNVDFKELTVNVTITSDPLDTVVSGLVSIGDGVGGVVTGTLTATGSVVVDVSSLDASQTWTIMYEAVTANECETMIETTFTIPPPRYDCFSYRTNGKYDKWRIDGGADINFPGGVATGLTSTANEMIATLPQPNVVNVGMVGTDINVSTNTGTITTIEVFDAVGLIWVSFNTLSTNRANPCV